MSERPPVPHLGLVFRDPAFITRRALSKSLQALVEDLALDGTGEWLDVGCGTRPYESLFHVGRYVGMDVEVSGRPASQKLCDVVYDGTVFPFPDAVFDGVLCTQVLEHASDPAALLVEITRVLRPGGYLVLTAPFVWEEHEQPYDFLRFTSFGSRHW